jgi:Putative zinc-finger
MMLSCKEATLLASKALDTRLTARERWAVRLHLLYCRGCARFAQHIQFLRRAARMTTDHLPAAAQRLPQAAQERIRSALHRER